MARAVLIASEFSSAGSLTRMPRCAPIASARRIASIALGGPIEMTVTSPASFSTSWSPASTPCSSPGSSTRSTPSRTNRLVWGSSLPGALGSGICFTQTRTFIGGCIHYGEIAANRTNVCTMIEDPNAKDRVLRDHGEVGTQPGAAHGLQLVAEPVPGLLSQLRLLLRPGSCQARRPRSRRGVQRTGGRQGQPSGIAPTGAFRAQLEARDGGVWNGDRPLPANRRHLPPDAPVPRGLPRLQDTGRPDHQGN